MGSPMTEADSILLVSLFISTHSLSDVALSDLLKLISQHCLVPNKCTTSIYRFRRISNQLLFKNHQFNCQPSKKLVCSICHEEISGLFCTKERYMGLRQHRDKSCELFTLALQPQLTRLIAEHGDEIARCKSNGTDQIQDVSDGLRFQRVKEIAGKFSVSLILNADGAPVFKSSQQLVWPLSCVVAELPPRLRYDVDNMILAAIWCGRTKPQMAIFLNAFVEEVKQLSVEGIKLTSAIGEEATWEVQALQVVADLPAKAQLVNHMQYNGYYGCTVYGVKGKAVLSDLLQIPEDVPVDYMHAILEGVVPQLLQLWFSSENHSKDYYLGRHKREISRMLVKIGVPHDFKRKPIILYATNSSPILDR
ncbi:uncharacterized protein LOC134185694 [Corticium candelabrum]|uniref:uncharacterized protein LOC134185694 n=1 Tax=Corticium candelabrum TaxID=121492 RepID=UPI002E2567D2|nr:uncharacterized protein LOC134185694 [Corticium candelabrum]